MTDTAPPPVPSCAAEHDQLCMPADALKRARHRLSIARGHLESIVKMLEKEDVYCVDVLRQIKALGVNIALDDFGTGYSSLEMLRSFPFDKIKLDRSFINEAEDSLQAKSIIRAVLTLGKSLEIPILAEGIETEGQLSLLGEEGCDEAQGFLLGRPIPIGMLVESGRISLNAEAASGQGPRVKTSIRSEPGDGEAPVTLSA